MPTAKGVAWPQTMSVLSLLILSVLVPLSMAAGASDDGDDPYGDMVPCSASSRAEGAEDVGHIPGKVNYYEDGYPPNTNVIYTMNISISFNWNLTHSQLNTYLGYVRNFQERFYDGADGQMAIEKLDIWNNQNHWDVTDVRYYNQNGRAFTYRGGISDEDAHIFMFTGDGGKVLHHEWGHYGMFLPDEYTDAGGAFCTCIMGSTWNTDQYCCDSNHNAAHQYAEAKSCWQQIKDRYTHVTEKDPPVSGPWDEPAMVVVWHEVLDLSTQSANFSIEPTSASVGDKLTIRTSFHNLNYSIDGEQKFGLYNGNPATGGVQIASQMVDLRDRTDFVVTFETTASEGTNTFYIMADPDDIIDEVNENNNFAGGDIYVNFPPLIDPPIPSSFEGMEDEPIIVDLSDYESDVEDAGTSLDWEVIGYDNTTIVDLQVDQDDDRFTFTPLANWYGKTTVEVRLSDSWGAGRDGIFDLVFRSVNDLPSVTNFSVDDDGLLRGEKVGLVLRGEDIETDEEQLNAVIEYKGPTGDWYELQTSWVTGKGFSSELMTSMSDALGAYSFRAMVKDGHNGASAFTYLNDSITVHNNMPTMMGMVIPEDVLYRTESMYIQMSAEDLEDDAEVFIWEVEVQYPDGEWVPYDGDLTYVFGSHQFEFAPDDEAQLGVYHFKARATDRDGAMTEWHEDATDVFVLNNLPTVEELTVDVKEMYRTQTILVTAKGSDVEQEEKDLVPEMLYTFGTNWVDDYLSEVDYDLGKEAWVAEFTPPANSPMGAVTFKVRFTDADGDPTDWMENERVQVLNNQPVAKATGPVKGMEGKKLRYFGSNSSDVEGALSYHWSFGDGQSSTEADPVHVFDSYGSYSVTLTVKDTNGMTATDSVVVRIDKKPDEPPPFVPSTGGDSMLGSLFLPLLAIIVAIVIILTIVGYAVHRNRQRDLEPAPPPADVGPGPGTTVSLLDGPGPGDDGASWKDVDDDDLMGPVGPPDTEGPVDGRPTDGPAERPEPGPPPPGPPSNGDPAGPPRPEETTVDEPKKPEPGPPPPGPPE